MRCGSVGLAVAAAVAGVGLGAWGVTRDVAACQPACLDLDGIEAMHHEVARNGVLVFRLDTIGYPDIEQLVEALDAEVRTEDGSRLAGDLALEHGLVVWRPGCALPEAERLRVSFTLDRGRTDLEDCEDVQTTFTVEPFEVVPRDVGLIDTASICARSVYAFERSDSIESLVCCDGAYPSQEYYVGSCYDEEPDIMVEQGACFARTGTGTVTTNFRFPIPSEESDAANLIVRMVFADGFVHDRLASSTAWDDSSMGSIWREVTSARDVRLELVSLATGQVVAGDTIHSDGGAPAALGNQTVDLEASLEGACTDPPYVCNARYDDIDLIAWDDQSCEPFQPEPGIDPANTGDTDPACTSYALRQVVAPEPPDEGGVCYLEDRGCACTPSKQDGKLGAISLLLLLGSIASRRSRAVTAHRHG